MFFQIFSVLILSSFYVCYFAKMISQHKKGIRTDQLGKDKVGLVKIIEISIKIISIITPIVEVISIVLNTTKLPVTVRIIGACLGLFGVLVFIASVLTMKDNWRAGVSKTDKTQLVKNGIYKISRNPAFLGFDLVYIGIMLMFFNWSLFAISCVAILMFHLQIVNVEEEYLIAAFGVEYQEYKKTVCRYLGRKFWK